MAHLNNEQANGSTAATGAGNNNLAHTPSSAVQAVLVQSTPMPSDSVQVKGYDFNNGIDYQAIMQSYMRTGYQATSVGQAIEEINRMVIPTSTHFRLPSLFVLLS